MSDWEKKHKYNTPLAFNEQEKKEISKKEIKYFEKEFAKELLTGECDPDPVQKPNVVVFDSKKGYIR